MEIGVLYDDFSIAWLPFEKRHDLKRNGVLAITITELTPPYTSYYGLPIATLFSDGDG